MKRFVVEVRNYVQVDIDETKMTEEFMKVFGEVIVPFQDHNEHAAHIAQMQARGLIGWDNFVEGYGVLENMGITVKDLDQEEEVDEVEYKEEDDGK